MRQPDSRLYKDNGRESYFIVLWKNAFRVRMVSVISFNQVTQGWCVTDFKQMAQASFGGKDILDVLGIEEKDA